MPTSHLSPNHSTRIMPRPGYLTSQATPHGAKWPNKPTLSRRPGGPSWASLLRKKPLLLLGAGGGGGGGRGSRSQTPSPKKKKAQSPDHGKLQHRPAKSTAPVLSIPALIGRACFAIPKKPKPKPYAPRLLACLLAGGSISTQVRVPVGNHPAPRPMPKPKKTPRRQLPHLKPRERRDVVREYGHGVIHTTRPRRDGARGM